MKSDSERFWSKTKDVDTCILWRGAVDRSTKRGVFKADGKTWDCARLAWAEENGPVPPGKVVKPACGNALCVRPTHLRPCRPGGGPTISAEEIEAAIMEGIEP